MSEEGSERGGEDLVIFQEAIKDRYGETVFDTWFADALMKREDDETVEMAASSPFKRDRIIAQFKPSLQRLLESTTGCKKLNVIATARLSGAAARIARLGDETVRQKEFFRRDEKRPVAAVRSGKARSDAKAAERGDGEDALRVFVTGVDVGSTFDSFAVDQSNRMAFAAARHVFSPNSSREVVYIHGPSGVGKTHLLCAVGNQWAQVYGPDEVAYFICDSFKTLCAEAATNNGLANLKRVFSKYRCIIIDDIHLLVGAHRSVKEVLNLLKNAPGENVQIVLAGDVAPLKLIDAGMDPRLADHLSGGYAAPVARGDESLRAEVLRKRIEASRHACIVSEDAVAYIARAFPQSMREAIGALNQIILDFGEEAVTVTGDMAHEALKDRIVERRREVSLDDLLEATSEVTGLTAQELTGKAQGQYYAKPRHAFVMVARDVLHESFPRIASVLNRDHTTAISGFRRAQDLFSRYQYFRDMVEDIKKRIGHE